MTLNQQVHRFATQRLGQRVGRGECFDLADLALRDAGAKSAADYGRVTRSADYVWGRAVTRQTARVGDVIQFRNYGFTETVVTVTERRDSGGRWVVEEDVSETRTQTRPHHTAIVDAIGRDGEITVLEQNVANVRRVIRNDLFFATRTDPPRVTIRGNQRITVRRSVSVQGQVRFYRPQSR